jgi:UDP-4-amino-4-deoxy-L-arabinose-oxoglutarate aminotransferase
MGFYSSKYSFKGNEFPVSLSWGNGTISIPLFPGIKAQEQDYVIDVLVNKIDKMIGESK